MGDATHTDFTVGIIKNILYLGEKVQVVLLLLLFDDQTNKQSL